MKSNVKANFVWSVESVAEEDAEVGPVINLTPFNFRPGWPKIRGAKKVLLFFGWPKIKGAEFFPIPLYNIKKKRKNVIYRGWPKIKEKGPNLGRVAENRRKLEGPKIKGAEN